MIDFSVERNPYQKIYIGIQDMKLDLMKSIVGDVVAAERLKKSKQIFGYTCIHVYTSCTMQKCAL